MSPSQRGLGSGALSTRPLNERLPAAPLDAMQMHVMEQDRKLELKDQLISHLMGELKQTDGVRGSFIINQDCAQFVTGGGTKFSTCLFFSFCSTQRAVVKCLRSWSLRLNFFVTVFFVVLLPPLLSSEAVICELRILLPCSSRASSSKSETASTDPSVQSKSKSRSAKVCVFVRQLA